MWSTLTLAIFFTPNLAIKGDPALKVEGKRKAENQELAGLRIRIRGDFPFLLHFLRNYIVILTLKSNNYIKLSYYELEHNPRFVE